MNVRALKLLWTVEHVIYYQWSQYIYNYVILRPRPSDVVLCDGDQAVLANKCVSCTRFSSTSEQGLIETIPCVCVDCVDLAICLEVASKSLRQMMMMLRGGTAPLMIESGRWRGLPREERRCRECQSGKIEDVPHWLLECHAWGTERQALLQGMRQVINDFDNLEDDKLVCILDRGCQHASILKAIMKMWTAQFY